VTESTPPATGAVSPAPQSIAPPDVPKSDPNYQEPARAKRARKAEAAPAVTHPASAVTDTGAVPKQVEGLHLHVNGFPMHALKDCQRLDVYAARMAAEAAKLLEVADLRLCEQGASKAKGMLAAMVRASPPPPGVYVAFPGNFDDPMHTVIEALGPIAATYTRGA
jgi:hypothetical protein